MEGGKADILLTIFIHVHWIRTGWLGFRIWIDLSWAELPRVVHLLSLTLLGLSSEEREDKMADILWLDTLHIHVLTAASHNARGTEQVSFQ